MKILNVLATCVMLLVVIESRAQTVAEITDEDLKKYAVTMDSVEGMQETLRDIVAERVRSNTAVPVARYNELIKLQEDSVKLNSTATPEELAFLREVDDLREANIERINATYQVLAKDYVGLKKFNLIRKSLESDQQLKARYDNVSKDVESKEKGG